MILAFQQKYKCALGNISPTCNVIVVKNHRKLLSSDIKQGTLLE